MAEYLIQDTTLTAIADAIRDKTGVEGEIAVSEMAGKIDEIQTETRIPVETTVDLDFSGGAMEVNPEAEELFSKINIPVPANLIPENIAKGVDIAGIVGALAAGSSVKIAVATLPASAAISPGENTVNHNLGVVPDIVFYNVGNKGITSGNSIMIAVGFSSAMASAHPSLLNRGAIVRGTTSSQTASFNIGEIDTVSEKSFGIHGATSSKFSLGNSMTGLSSNFDHEFILIGGLT